MKVILLEDDNAYEHLMQDFKKVIKEAIKEAVFELKNKTENSETSWVTNLEAMKILSCKKDKLNQLRASNSLKSSKHGRKILYYRQSLYSFLEKHTL